MDFIDEPSLDTNTYVFFNYQTLSVSQRKMLHDRMVEVFPSYFQFSVLTQLSALITWDSSNIESIYNQMASINLNALLHTNNSERGYFSCFLHPGNLAFIRRDKNGHYRYISISSTMQMAFDLFDFFQLFYGANPVKTILQIANDYLPNLNQAIQSKKKQEEKKYDDNILMLHNYLETNNDELSEYLMSTRDIWNYVNQMGKSFVYRHFFLYQEASLFFISYDYIANSLSKTSKEVTQTMNLFTLLGLIQKIDARDLPSFLYQRALHFSQSKHRFRMISFFVIPPLETAISIARERAKQLKKHGIHHYQIDQHQVAYLFGEGVARNIYHVSDQISQRKKQKTKKDIHECVEKQFIQQLLEKKWIAKSDLLNQLTNKNNENEIFDWQLEVNRVWKTLINKYDCQLIKPNKRMKQEYGLCEDTYIAIPKKRK